MTSFAEIERAFRAKAQADPWDSEIDSPTTWSDTFDAMHTLQVREENSNSAARALIDMRLERADVIAGLGGNRTLAEMYAQIPENYLAEWRQYEREGRLFQAPTLAINAYWADAYQHVREYEREYPDQVKSDDVLFEDFKAEAAEKRAGEMDTIQRGPGTAAFAGTAVGVMQDPLILMTLPFGAQYGAGRSLAATIGRTAMVEASIAVATEIPIQAQVARFKRELEAPWTFKDSAVNVLSAGLGAGVLGGGLAGGIGGLKKLRGAYRDAKEAGRVAATKEMEQADAILEATIELQAQNPLRPLTDDTPVDFTARIHETAFDTARAQHEAGMPVDVAPIVRGIEPEDPVNDALVRMDDPAELLEVDPRTVEIDPPTFQYKSGTDADGVNDALKGVKRFNRLQAGISLIWERSDGTRFVADGHQRRNLALRMLDAGQPEDEVKLNGFIVRESDGVTSADARQMAAIKNLGSGNGSALDAAKVLREVGPMGRAMLPELPPNSALVRQAHGLAKLGDDQFMQVVNDAIPQSYGAIVGAATLDPKLQQAMIEVLRKTKPANQTQARSIVDQVKTAGVEVRTTEDLFGSNTITESLYLERAQVLDSALREARKDKAVFGRLVSEEGRIEQAGQNMLDTATNMQRVQEARDATAKISKLANAKGPVSEALTEAARAVKGGAKPGAAASDFLTAARRAILEDNSGGPQARRAGASPDAADVTRRLEPKVGEPVHYSELPKAERAAAFQALIARQMDDDMAAIYRAAEAHQKELSRIAKEVSADLGEDVVITDPGIKLRATDAEKLTRTGKRPGELTDIVRLGFMVRTPELAATIIRRLGDRLEILDEGVTTTGMGYLDHKALVRFSDGRVGEVQLWDPKIAEAKFGAGGEIYDSVRSISAEDMARDPALAARLDAAEAASKDLYAQALADASSEWWRVAMQALPEDMRTRVQAAVAAGAGRGGAPGNISKKSAREISEPDSKISTGEARDQAPSPEATKKPSTPPEGVERITAGRPSQLKNLSAIDAPPRGIVRQIDADRTPAPEPTRTGTIDDIEYQAVMDELDDLVDKQGELLQVSREVNGELEVRSAQRVIDELDTLEETFERIRICSVAEEAAA